MKQPHNQVSRLGQFILVRFLATGTRPTRSAIDSSLKRYFASRLSLSDGEWRALLEKTLQELVDAGLLNHGPYQLTETGRGEAHQFLGVESLPATKWQTIRNRQLVAKALGLTPLNPQQWQQIGLSAGVRAAVLVNHYQLPISPLSTPSQALHALAWQQMQMPHHVDVPAGKKFTHLSVLAATVMKGQTGKPEERLPALVSGAKRNHPDAVREAVICNWLGDEEAAETRVAPAAPFNLRDFAAHVRQAAQQATEGRFGENKVFISHVWHRVQQLACIGGMSREEFDRHLVNANRERLLTLSRADLIAAMDSQDVQSSEIKGPYASFHFIRTDK